MDRRITLRGLLLLCKSFRAPAPSKTRQQAGQRIWVYIVHILFVHFCSARGSRSSHCRNTLTRICRVSQAFSDSMRDLNRKTRSKSIQLWVFFFAGFHGPKLRQKDLPSTRCRQTSWRTPNPISLIFLRSNITQTEHGRNSLQP